MRASYLVRAASLLAIVVVLLAAWTVNRTIERARQSNQWVAHTQEVLAATETVLAMLVDAETGVRGYMLSVDRRDLEALDRALAAPLALLGDHVLLDFVRTTRALPR